VPALQTRQSSDDGCSRIIPVNKAKIESARRINTPAQQSGPSGTAAMKTVHAALTG
jgi:hypothetical protein